MNRSINISIEKYTKLLTKKRNKINNRRTTILIGKTISNIPHVLKGAVMISLEMRQTRIIQGYVAVVIEYSSLSSDK